MHKRFAALVVSQPSSGARPLHDAFGALSLCVTFVGLMFLPGFF